MELFFLLFLIFSTKSSSSTVNCKFKNLLIKVYIFLKKYYYYYYY